MRKPPETSTTLRPPRWSEGGLAPSGMAEASARLGQRSGVFPDGKRLLLDGPRGPRQRRALHGARPPRLMLVREPDQLGVEREHALPAFGGRLVELAVPHRHVAADNDRTA